MIQRYYITPLISSFYLFQLLFEQGYISGTVWFMGVGVGIYLTYVPIASCFSDRVIAALGENITASFLINMWDTLGGVGIVTILIIYQVVENIEVYEFFNEFVLYTSVAMFVVNLLSMWYWNHAIERSKRNRKLLLSSASEFKHIQNSNICF
jgi:hypothetical protein